MRESENRPVSGTLSGEMATLRARVQNGRLVLDAPTDLPEGTEVELVVAEDLVANAIANAIEDHRPLSEEEQLAIDRVRNGEARLIPHAEVRRKLANRSGE